MDQSYRSILWRRLDRPGHEAAVLLNQSPGWRLVGSALFLHDRLPCRLDYAILCDAAWVTLAARVSGWVGGGQVELEISVDKMHNWWMNGEANPAVAGCLDLDLNFSPVTNTLPVRRLALEVGQAEGVRAAWLRFPSFKLEPLEQRYSRVGAASYRYESAGGRFLRDLAVDEAGFVTDYPDFWQSEATTAS